MQKGIGTPRKTISQSLYDALKKRKNVHLFDVERALFRDKVIGCGVEPIEIVLAAEKEKWVKFNPEKLEVSLLISP